MCRSPDVFHDNARNHQFFDQRQRCVINHAPLLSLAVFDLPRVAEPILFIAARFATENALVVVKLKGGLGNQMFQFAFYQTIVKRRKDVCVDTRFFDRNIERRYELEKGICVKPPQYYGDWVVRGTQKLSGLLRKHFFAPHVLMSMIDEAEARVSQKHSIRFSICYDSGKVDVSYFLALKNVIFDGYWQSPSYFDCCEPEIRKCFEFRQIDSCATRAAADRIRECESVSIHFRWGDYISNPHFAQIYSGICTEQYYEKAVR